MSRLVDYARWHHLQVATDDVDPTYPVLRHIARTLDLDRDAAAWLVLLHVAYYDLGSALRAFASAPTPRPPTPDLLALPTGTERRGNRDRSRFAAHWRALLDVFAAHGGPGAWITAGGTEWPALTAHLAAVYGNGRWAAYKTGELAQKVLGVPTVITDAGHAHSTGPRHGLALLYPIPDGNTPAVVEALDRITADLAHDLGEPDIGRVETTLCDFHSLTRGRYYLGHDIDAMLHQIRRTPSDLTPVAMHAREATLPATYLGEVNGWTGVDLDRCRAYRDRGVVLTR